ncbi:monovalent cation/H(+) antiporter subunit G [Coprothermobacteraceae bacterium]|nr:monovalent cation/H(+) antiporter subunit G [Coprothermobacteraceae bacterium]
MSWNEWIGWAFVWIGVFFQLLGALGLVRMPDVYTRMQTATKAATFGVLGISLGIAYLSASSVWILKSAVFALLMILTNPVGASTLIRAAHKLGIKAYTKDGEAHVRF